MSGNGAMNIFVSFSTFAFLTLAALPAQAQ